MSKGRKLDFSVFSYCAYHSPQPRLKYNVEFEYIISTTLRFVFQYHKHWKDDIGNFLIYLFITVRSRFSIENMLDNNMFYYDHITFSTNVKRKNDV